GIIKNYRYRKDIEFEQQCKAMEKEYNHFSQNTPYQKHPTAIMTSRPINTKHITEQLRKFKSSDLDIDSSAATLSLDEINLQGEQETIQEAQIFHQPYGTPGSPKNPK